MECFRKCFQQPPPKDDGEWIQPVHAANKRHVAPVEESTMGRKTRASVSVKGVEELKQRGTTVRWSEMVRNLDDLDVDDLDNSKYDEHVIASVNAADQRDSELFDTMGRLTMGSRFSEDSYSRELGGFKHRHSGDSAVSFGTERESVDSKGSLGRPSDRSTKVHGILKNAHPGEDASQLPPGEETAKQPKIDLLRSSAKKVMFATASLKSFAKNRSFTSQRKSNSSTEEPKIPAITSITALRDGFFLTASRSESEIKMHKIVGEGVEFVRGFKGHKSGVTALATLDNKGRFLSAGNDKTVILWDSRFDIEEDSDDEAGMAQEPRILLATFHYSERYVISMGVLNEGSYVRPTDNVDMAMVTAMAKKTALEGAASTQRAAIQRQIIECSGSFATLSKNEKNIKIWAMTCAEEGNENAANVKLVHELEHEASIGAMAVRGGVILAGDIMGDVYMWGEKKSFGSKSSWTKLHRFTAWRKKTISHTTEQLSEQSVRSLCFLDKGTFVSGTRKGTVRVWSNIEAAQGFDVHKRQASSVKVTSKSVSSIQKLPPVKDPNTGEVCMAFSVAFSDGRMVSMALYPQDPAQHEKNELVMFHVYSNTTDDDSNSAINCIAVSGPPGDDKGNVFDPVLIAGDSDGAIKTLKPKWNAFSSASV